MDNGLAPIEYNGYNTIMRKEMRHINNKYFMKFNLLWLLAPVPMFILSEETPIIAFMLMGVTLVLVPYLTMNIMLWRKLSQHMKNDVVRSNMRFFNSIKVATKLGLQKSYCRSVNVWLWISVIGVIMSGIVVKIGYTRWAF